MSYEKVLERQIARIKEYEGQIVLFGAGEIGIICKDILNLLGKRNIVFCDNNKKLNGEKISGTDCMGVEDTQKKYKKALAIVCAYKKKATDEMKSQIQKETAWEVCAKEALLYVYTCEISKRNVNKSNYTKALQKVAETDDDRIINSDIALCITANCTLKCESCAYLMPYIKERAAGRKEELVESVKKLVQVKGAIMLLTIVGGEPFASSDLAWICEQLAVVDEILMIRIVTNGTILPSEKTWKRLSGCVTWIAVSDYGVLSSQKEQLLQEAEKNNILSYKIVFSQWHVIKLPIAHRRSEEENRMRKETCRKTRGGNTIINSRFYGCGYYAWAVEGKLIKALENSYVDLKLRDEEIEEQLKKLEQSGYAVCDYCSTNYSEAISVAKQVRG